MIHHVKAIVPVEVGGPQFGLVLIDLGLGSISFDFGYVYGVVVAVEEPAITTQAFVDLPHKIRLLLVHESLKNIDGWLLLVIPQYCPFCSHVIPRVLQEINEVVDFGTSFYDVKLCFHDVVVQHFGCPHDVFDDCNVL